MVKIELENEKTQDQLNAFEASEVEESKAPSNLSMKLNDLRTEIWDGTTRLQDTVDYLGGRASRNQESE